MMNNTRRQRQEAQADSSGTPPLSHSPRKGGSSVSNQAMLAAANAGRQASDLSAAREREAATFGALGRLASGGERLPASLRQPAEQAMGLDLGQVRLHRDERAEAVTRAAAARAAQWRNHVIIRPDRFAPDTGEGRRLK